MQIYIDKNIDIKQGTALTIGNFDGLHIGHKHLIDKMKHLAKEKNLLTGIFTFYNHTLNTLNSNRKQKILVSNEKKISLINNMNLDLLYMVTFSEDLKNLTPEQFVIKYLIEQLNVKLLVVGLDFRFGKSGKGDTELLKVLGKEFGFDVVVEHPLKYDNIVVSSTVIRRLVSNGLINDVNRLLNRPYSLTGVVKKGKSRGNGLGFPTANLELEVDYVIPKTGVYMTTTKVEGKTYLSATSIGKNPTFEDDNVITIETFILDFNNDIYNKKIEVNFLEFIRDERKFLTKEELINQISDDINEIKSKKYLFTQI